MKKIINWGIMGGGGISQKFASTLQNIGNAKLVAVASQSGKSVIQAPKYYKEYIELAEDPDIDIVYIGTIHPLHLQCAEACLNAKKAVLCEKPLAMNTTDAQKMMQLAEKNNVFFMEAMWTRFLPAGIELIKQIKSGKYGKVQYLQLPFGFEMGHVPRLEEKKLGGGVTLDIGIYPVTIADMLLDEAPSKIHAWAEKNQEGVDTEVFVQMEYPCGALANISYSSKRSMRNVVTITTDKADFVMPDINRPTVFYRYPAGSLGKLPTGEQINEYPLAGSGYEHEILEAQRCFENGLLQSPIMPHETSNRVMQTLDKILAIIGVDYAGV